VSLTVISGACCSPDLRYCRNICHFSSKARRLEVPIEPLVGHLRNPYWNENCKFPKSPAVVLKQVLFGNLLPF
jgi:hypothetical protein